MYLTLEEKYINRRKCEEYTTTYRVYIRMEQNIKNTTRNNEKSQSQTNSDYKCATMNTENVIQW